MHLQDGRRAWWEPEKHTANQRWWYVTVRECMMNPRSTTGFLLARGINRWRGTNVQTRGPRKRTPPSLSAAHFCPAAWRSVPTLLPLTQWSFPQHLQLFGFSCFPSLHPVRGGQERGNHGVRYPNNLYRHNKPKEAGCFSLELQSPYKPWLMKSWDVACL